METKHVQFTEEREKRILFSFRICCLFTLSLLRPCSEDTVIKRSFLQNSARAVVDEGLKNVHNDTCYPALLVIGQFLDALKSGKYDPDKVALMISQTGGGCRASNYLHLLRKALEAEYPQIPVISLNFSGLEKSPGFKLTLPLLLKLVDAVLYGDLMMMLYNQCKPYEVNEGDTDAALAATELALAKKAAGRGFGSKRKNYKLILDAFAAVRRKNQEKPRVGIVGEIYVKYSPLANNHLEEFLIREGMRAGSAGLMDFVLYCAVNNVNDGRIYGFKNTMTRVSSLLYKYLLSLNRKLGKAVDKYGCFRSMTT